MHGPEIFEDISEYLWYIELYVIQSYTAFRFSPCFSSWKSTNLYFSWGHTSRRCWAIMGVALKHLERTQNHPQLWRWLSNKDTSIFNLHFCRARIRPLLMTHPTRAIAPIILKDYLQIRPATSKRFVYFVYPSCTLCTLDQRDLLSCLPAGYVSVLSASNPFNFHWVNGLCTNDFIHSSDPQCTTRLAINVQGTGRVRSAPWDEGWADSKLVAKFA